MTISNSEHKHVFFVIIKFAFSMEKAPLLEMICDHIGYITLQTDQWNILTGKIDLGDMVIFIHELHQQQPYFAVHEFPGIPLGTIYVFDNTRPETFREVEANFSLLKSYSPLPVLGVANPRPLWGRGEQAFTHRPDMEWELDDLRVVFQLAPSIPLIRASLADRENVKSVLIKLAETALAFHEETEQLPDADIEDMGLPLHTDDDLFTPGQEHRWVIIFGMGSNGSAHYMMDRLTDEYTWVQVAFRELPLRIGKISIDDALTLHLMPVDRFATRDDLDFLVEQIAYTLQFPGSEPPSDTIVPDFTVPDGVLAYIGLPSGLNQRHTYERIGVLMKAAGSHPLLLELPPDYHPARILPGNVSIIHLHPDETDFAKHVFCLLANQLPEYYRERIQRRFDC